MKNILLLSILLFAGAAFGAPSAKQIAAYDANKRAQLIEWIEQLRVKAGEADAKAVAAQSALDVSTVELATAQKNLEILKADIEGLRRWGMNQQRAYLKAKEAYDELLPKYHRLKLWVGLALACGAGLLVGIVIWRYAAPALNTVPGAILAFGVPVAAAGTVFAAVQGFF